MLELRDDEHVCAVASEDHGVIPQYLVPYAK